MTPILVRLRWQRSTFHSFKANQNLKVSLICIFQQFCRRMLLLPFMKFISFIYKAHCSWPLTKFSQHQNVLWYWWVSKGSGRLEDKSWNHRTIGNVVQLVFTSQWYNKWRAAWILIRTFKMPSGYAFSQPHKEEKDIDDRFPISDRIFRPLADRMVYSKNIVLQGY